MPYPIPSVTWVLLEGCFDQHDRPNFSSVEVCWQCSKHQAMVRPGPISMDGAIIKSSWECDPLFPTPVPHCPTLTRSDLFVGCVQEQHAMHPQRHVHQDVRASLQHAAAPGSNWMLPDSQQADTRAVSALSTMTGEAVCWSFCISV